jgi:hypothetical protein
MGQPASGGVARRFREDLVMRIAIWACAAALAMPVAGLAKDNLASNPVNLPDLELHEDLTISQTE